MSDQKHTPGPWRVEFSRPCSWFIREDGVHLPGTEANRDRIEACVNALEGIEDPAAFVEAAVVAKGILLGWHEGRPDLPCLIQAGMGSEEARRLVSATHRWVDENIKGDD